MMAKVRHLFASLLVALSLQPPVLAAPILLKAETLDPAAPGARAATSALIRKSAEIKERDVYLIQAEELPTPEWRAAIEKAGAVIRSYVPENAYIVEADADALRAIVADVSCAFLGPFQAKWRVDGSLADFVEGAQHGEAGEIEAEADGTALCDVLLFDPSFRKAVSARIAALPDCPVITESGAVVRARLTAEAVAEVSSWVEVQWVERHFDYVLANGVAVDSARMNVRPVWPDGSLSLNLTGEGQIIAIADTGLDTGNTSTLNTDIRNRLVRAHALGRTDNWSDPHGHGTHVAGSAVGNGGHSPSSGFKGTAYGARLIFQSVLDSSGGLDGIPADLNDLFDQAYAAQDDGTAGARIHSDSWGHSGAASHGVYNAHTREVDEFTFAHPDMLVVFCAGNNGRDANADGVVDTGSVWAPATAKNCLTVGASENSRTVGGYAERTYGVLWDEDFTADPIKGDFPSLPSDNIHQGMAAFSSRGPCDDGRVKPDIVAPGTDVLSMRSSVAGDTHFWGNYDSFYAYMGGTSMATPLTSGSAALARQWLASSRGISNPDGATLKALLLAGARSLSPGQYGTGNTREIPSSYPNNVEGWGQVDLGHTLVNADGLVVKDAQVIAQGETHTFRFTANVGQPVSVVMAYTDAPASTSASTALVNDLNLTVRTPHGETFFPNSRTSADTVNNVEGVRISSPDSGIYTVTVHARLVATPMDTSLTGGRANATRYSLVVNGGTEVRTFSLPVAVDNTTLSFTTGGYASWFGQSIMSHDGVDAAQSGALYHNQNSWMQTKVTGPGTISFWWNVRSQGIGKDFLEFLVDGDQWDKIGGAPDSWALRMHFLPDGEHTLRWRYRKDASNYVVLDCGWVDQISWQSNKIPVSFNANGGICATASRVYTLGSPYGTFPTDPVWSGYVFEGWYTSASGGTRVTTATVVTATVPTLYAHWSISLPVALDNTSLTFTTGGGANWFGQTDVTHDGVDAARSGAISHNQDSWMQTTVTGPGALSFWWNVSSEGGNYDYLDFLVDGTSLYRIGGESASWTQKACFFESGTHTLKWNYRKDVSMSYGSDCGWVDQVAWTPGVLPSPVYRFYSSKFKSHFYTMSESEKTKLETSDPNWRYEMVAYRAFKNQAAGTVPLYRFYSSKFKGHFYTRSESEKTKLETSDPNWRYEQIAYYVYPSAVYGAKPVYRFWSAKFKHHFYTMSESEKTKLETSDPNWRYEQVAFYAMPNAASSSSIHAASPRTGAQETAAASSVAVESRGAAVAQGVRLETRPDGLLVEPGETLDLGGLMLEARAEEPADFAAGSPAPLGDAAPGFRLSLPEGGLRPSLWNAADGTLIEGEAGESAFDFTLPASDVWQRLFIRDGGDREVWSLWMRALSGL